MLNAQPTPLLPRKSIQRIRVYVACRYPAEAHDPAFNTVIGVAARMDIPAIDKYRLIGKNWRRVLACAVLQAELERIALGIPSPPLEL